jgi:hypothetical protein
MTLRIQTGFRRCADAKEVRIDSRKVAIRIYDDQRKDTETENVRIYIGSA